MESNYFIEPEFDSTTSSDWSMSENGKSYRTYKLSSSQKFGWNQKLQCKIYLIDGEVFDFGPLFNPNAQEKNFIVRMG